MNFISSFFSAIFSFFARLFGRSQSEGFKPGVWSLAYSHNVPGEIVRSFEFPQTDGVHYSVRPKGGTLKENRAMHLRFKIEGSGKLIPTQGSSAAKVRLYFQRKGDHMTAGEEYKRWWSRDFVALTAPGEGVLHVPLTAEHWTSVFGKGGETNRSAWKDCLDNAANVGFTFGGEFAGHGVYANAKGIKFTVLEWNENASSV